VAVAQRPLRRAERQRLLRAAREGQRASDNSDESSCSSKRGAASSEKPRLKKSYAQTVQIRRGFLLPYLKCECDDGRMALLTCFFIYLLSSVVVHFSIVYIYALSEAGGRVDLGLVTGRNGACLYPGDEVRESVILSWKNRPVLRAR